MFKRRQSRVTTQSWRRPAQEVVHLTSAFGHPPTGHGAREVLQAGKKKEMGTAKSVHYAEKTTANENEKKSSRKWRSWERRNRSDIHQNRDGSEPALHDGPKQFRPDKNRKDTGQESNKARRNSRRRSSADTPMTQLHVMRVAPKRKYKFDALGELVVHDGAPESKSHTGAKVLPRRLSMQAEDLPAIEEDGEDEEDEDIRFEGAVDWSIELLDDDQDVWHVMKAKSYNSQTSSLEVQIQGKLASVDLDFNFIELIARGQLNTSSSNEDDKEVFQSLLYRQKQFRQQSPKFNTKTLRSANNNEAQDDQEPYCVEGLRRVPNLRRHSTIGTGLSGFVKVALHAETGQVVALKVLPKRQLVKYKQQQNALREKQAMAELCDFPFCVNLIATTQTRDALFIIQELIPGGELFGRLHPGGRKVLLEDSAATFYAGCALSVLEHLHRNGWVYRDLKPENCLIDQAGYIRVCDFGFCKKINKDGRCNSFLGTAEYMAPEIVTRSAYDYGVDCWALGCLMHEMMAGVTPTRTGSSQKTYELIAQSEFIYFDKHRFSSTALDLMRGLMTKDRSKRLTIEQAKAHRWFADLDFAALLQKSVQAPWIPPETSDIDLTHFDKYSKGDGHDTIEPYCDDSTWSEGF